MAEARPMRRAEARLARRRARVEQAPTPTAMLDAAYDLLRASLRRREAKDQAHADMMRERIARQILDTAQQLDRIKE